MHTCLQQPVYEDTVLVAEVLLLPRILGFFLLFSFLYARCVPPGLDHGVTMCSFSSSLTLTFSSGSLAVPSEFPSLVLLGTAADWEHKSIDGHMGIEVLRILK